MAGKLLGVRILRVCERAFQDVSAVGCKRAEVRGIWGSKVAVVGDLGWLKVQDVSRLFLFAN